MPGRVIAIGDVHGCAAALAALLAAIGPRPDDTIIPLGDYINRGSDSRGVLDRLIALNGECHLVPILGNHDQMLLDARKNKYALDRFLGMDGASTLESYGPGRSPNLIPAGHFAFLEGCRDYHETETHIFTHANFEPDLPMAEQPAGMYRWASLRQTIPGPHESGKTVILGHTAQKGGEILDLGHLRCIDTYCHGGGWLTALDVQTDEVWQVDREGRSR